MTSTINNTSINILKETLNTYYNNYLFKEKLPNSLSTSDKYFYKEIEDISNTSVQATSKESDALKNFNDFIRGCINYKITDSITDLYPLFKIKDSSTSTADSDVIKNIHANINLLNVIIDIFEAYKNFIDEDPLGYKNKLKTITKIMLVNKYSRLSADTNIKNKGFINDNIDGGKTLVLSINSFDDNIILTPTSGTINITNAGYSTPTPISTVNSVYFMDNITSAYKNYKNVSFSTPSSSSSPTDTEKYNNNITTNTSTDRKIIINNVLCFLVNLKKEDVRLNVLGLYYYYKYILYQVLFTCSSINVMINDMSLSTTLPVITLPFNISNVYDSAYFSIDEKQNSSPLSADTILTNYDNTVKYINNDINNLINKLYTISADNNGDLKYEFINNITFNATVPITNDKDASILNLTILLTPNSLLINSLKNVIDTPLLKLDFIDKFTFVYNGMQYIINDIKYDITNINLKIIAKYNTSTAITIESQLAPQLQNDYSSIDPVQLNNCKFVKKNLITLKNDYMNNKKQLSDVNKNIQYNTIKINNQKVNFNSNKNKDDLLNNQILSYNIILGGILAVFIMIHIINIEKGMRKMLSIIFAGIIIALIIINYIINASYLEENFSNNTIENFGNITTSAQLKSLISLASYKNDKRDYLKDNLDTFNKTALDYFQKISAIIPLAESQDFYGELNGIMQLERLDKNNINDILTYKKNLGNSNVDILKYNTNNKKVYVSSILALFFVFSILYLISLFIPDEFKNLIIFTAFIFGIIIFSYYIIFTNKLVKTKSNNIYWGPQTNDKF